MMATLRALPTLTRIGLVEALAYRAEMVVWLLTTTMPLVMLGLWTSVADEAPFRAWATRDFVAYYLVVLIVRNLTSNWVAWQMSEEIRTGTVAARLLRPLHPFTGYLGTHLGAVPLRALAVAPVIAIVFASSARGVLVTDGAHLALVAAALIGAWLLTFGVFLCLGALAFFLDKTLGIIEVYFGVFAILSGYLVPLPLLPGWMQDLAAVLPFRSMLGDPVAIVIGRVPDATAAARLVALQWAWAAALLALAAWLWRAGVRRYEAFGG
ncbi:MAG: ABC-2 family transporter protein [Myxococcales bacterium]|nr:ABC-2 family transporter protein [Myxococcales bacterium]